MQRDDKPTQQQLDDFYRAHAETVGVDVPDDDHHQPPKTAAPPAPPAMLRQLRQIARSRPPHLDAPRTA